MSDSYVTSGAVLRCTFGDKTSRLVVLPDRTVCLTGPFTGNVSDHIPMCNILPFGRCHTVCYPPTGSATAANHGRLTPMPCIPGTINEWLNGKTDYLVKGKCALLKSSICRCQYGGIISIVDDGQSDTCIIDNDREERETEEEIKKKSDEKIQVDSDAVLDGIQIVLDGLGFVPILGAAPDLLNASISACRGDWTSAGISLVAAVPGIGDAMGGANIARKAYKIAKKVPKVADAKKMSKVSQKEIAITPKTSVPKTQQGNVVDFQSVKGKHGIAAKEHSNVVSLDDKRSGSSPKKTYANSSLNKEHEVIHVKFKRTEGKKQVNGASIEGKTSVEVIGRESNNTIYNSTSPLNNSVQGISHIPNYELYSNSGGRRNGQKSTPKQKKKEKSIFNNLKELNGKKSTSSNVGNKLDTIG